MEKAKLLCEAIPKQFGKYRVFVQDLKGRQITGILPISDNYLDVNILAVEDEKAFVLLPKGLNQDTAWINSINLN